MARWVEPKPELRIRWGRNKARRRRAEAAKVIFGHDVALLLKTVLTGDIHQRPCLLLVVSYVGGHRKVRLIPSGIPRDIRAHNLTDKFVVKFKWNALTSRGDNLYC